MCDSCDVLDLIHKRALPVIPSPGGIPPWDPPENDSGEWIAYEGWTEWVRSHGTLIQRMQLLSFRIESTFLVFGARFVQASQGAAQAVTRFVRILNQPPP